MVAEKLSMFLKALDREKAKAIFKVAMISPVEVKLVVCQNVVLTSFSVKSE